ncbi:MAG: S1-like domain-containing RNA-binding protein [Chthoniobacteraceae bacterium]
MVEIGRRHKLRAVRAAPPGLFLDGEDLGEILLPGSLIPPGVGIGGDVDVFIYCDSEDRLVATTTMPRVMAGEVECLEVVGGNRQLGAFLDWGLPKDLLLPMRDQTGRIRDGDRVVVFVYVDEVSGRIVASMRLDKFLDREPPRYEPGQRVALLIAEETDLGYKAVIENAHWGLLYHSDLGAGLAVGARLDGYVREIRPDGKIDLTLSRAGRSTVPPLALRIVEALRANGGQLDLDDSSPPELIRARFSVSKKAFKQAIGALYRERRIRLDGGAIRLVE